MGQWRSIAVLMAFVAAAVIAANCDSGQTGQPCEGLECVNQPQTVAPACDPDGRAPCPDSWFTCTEDGRGGKTCEEPAPMPDGGTWDCEQQGTTLICRGDHMPGDAGDWECEEWDDGTVVCRRHAYVPSGGGEGRWECEYEGEFRICEFISEGDSGGDADVDGDSDSDSDIPDDGGFQCPPGVEIPTDEICGDGIDNNCDGRVDETCPDYEEPPCVCIPGAWRYCDTPDYCLWGTQVCLEDGMEWGPCLEVRTIPSECASGDGWYSPSAQACCVRSGFCCQDMWDLNRNGDTWESLGDCIDIVCVPPEA